MKPFHNVNGIIIRREKGDTMNKRILIVLIILLILIIGAMFLSNLNGIKQSKNVEQDNRQEAFEGESSFFGTVIESKVGYVIVEPDESEEERKSADKISISLGEHSDVLYHVGTRVKVTYTGGIMETYPAQINAVKIEVKSADKFELKLGQNTVNTKIKKIIDKEETDLFDYNVYEYNCDINIILDGEEMLLKDALLKYPNLANEIIAQANYDLHNKKIKGDMYKDGGSMIYYYNDYTIIKMHTLDGNRDIYIGTTDMTMQDI